MLAATSGAIAPACRSCFSFTLFMDTDHGNFVLYLAKTLGADASCSYCGDLDIGVGKFSPNEKHMKRGWQNYHDAWIMLSHSVEDLSMLKSPSSRRLSETTVLVVILATVLSSFSCEDLGEPFVPAPRIQVITVALRNTETYQWLTNLGGDEEGVRITTQAQHYQVSEVWRDARTSFLCVYVYEPQAFYVGSDYVELELRTSRTGAPEDTQVSRLGITFTISN